MTRRLMSVLKAPGYFDKCEEQEESYSENR